MIDKEKELKKARKVVAGIVAIGVIMLAFLNWNINLVFSGNQYQGEVQGVSTAQNLDNLSLHSNIGVLFTKNDSIAQASVRTYTKNFLNISKGDQITIFESKTEPYIYYLPKANYTASLLVLLFFVGIPLLFGIFGRV